MKTIYVSIISFVTNCLPPSGKSLDLSPPLPSEILASDPPLPFGISNDLPWGGVWIFSGTAHYHFTTMNNSNLFHDMCMGSLNRCFQYWFLKEAEKRTGKKIDMTDLVSNQCHDKTNSNSACSVPYSLVLTKQR